MCKLIQKSWVCTAITTIFSIFPTSIFLFTPKANLTAAFVSRLKKCLQSPVSRSPLIAWSERSTSRPSSEPSRTAVGRRVSASFPHLGSPHPTKHLLLTGNLRQGQVWPQRMAHRWRTAALQQEHTSWLICKQLIHLRSLPDLRCKVGQSFFVY